MQPSLQEGPPPEDEALLLPPPEEALVLLPPEDALLLPPKQVEHTNGLGEQVRPWHSRLVPTLGVSQEQPSS